MKCCWFFVDYCCKLSLPVRSECVYICIVLVKFLTGNR